jgi:hypothetical protein
MDGSEIFDSFHTNYYIVFINFEIFEIYCFQETKKFDSCSRILYFQHGIFLNEIIIIGY